jgi:hypothetical protein
MGLPLQCELGLVCYEGVCITSFCDSGTKNGNESDVDCGGACDPCSGGAMCDHNDYNCVSGQCLGDMDGPGGGDVDPVCAPDTCGNAELDGDETDLDCGGSCRGCDINGGCIEDSDCESLWCNNDVCKTPSCIDGIQNGRETDLDCGGNCDGCVPGQACIEDWDCDSMDHQGARCVDDTCVSCDDGVQNGDETDIDCGGSDYMCDRCAVGASCIDDYDCEDGQCGACYDNVCRSCSDNIQNGDEDGIDCGGMYCPPCA